MYRKELLYTIIFFICLEVLTLVVSINQYLLVSILGLFRPDYAISNGESTLDELTKYVEDKKRCLKERKKQLAAVYFF